MNKEYVTIGKDLLVTNENGDIKKFINDDLTLKKLQLENDIEKLEVMKNKCSKSLLNNNHFIKEGKVSSLGVLAVTLIFNLASFNIIPLLIGVAGASVCLFGALKLKRENKSILQEEKYIQKMIDLVTKEKEELENQEVCKNEIEIEKSDEVIIHEFLDGPSIEEMNNYLKLIYLYQKEKKQILTYYKNGSLGVWMGYSGYDANALNFMVNLIEEDLDINNEKGKSLIKK